jgi:hypothetical protein
MKNMNQACQRFIEFEERAAALYRKFAGQFPENSGLSNFWLKMSMEEQQHAGFLKFCEENLIEPADEREFEKMDRLIDRLERRADRSSLSVDEAFVIAAELESSEIIGIYRRLIDQVPGTSYLLRRRIETTTSGHMRDLLQGARTFGVGSSTIARMTEMDRAHAAVG